MTSTTLSGILWVDDDTSAAVSNHEDMAVIHLGRPFDPVVTIHAHNDGDVVGPARRTADLTILRNLARKMLRACEVELAVERDKASRLRGSASSAQLPQDTADALAGSKAEKVVDLMANPRSEPG